MSKKRIVDNGPKDAKKLCLENKHDVDDKRIPEPKSDGIDAAFDRESDLLFGSIDLESLQNDHKDDSRSNSPIFNSTISRCDVTSDTIDDGVVCDAGQQFANPSVRNRVDGIVGEMEVLMSQTILFHQDCNESLNCSVVGLEDSVLDSIVGNLNDNGCNTLATPATGRNAFERFYQSQCEDCSFYGLPMQVRNLLEEQKGITSLYAWQEECLQSPNLQARRNMILSLPTSGGKTLIAELLILKEVLCRKCDALLVLPYISIVQEKVRDLSLFAVHFNFAVEEYAGGKGRFPPKQKRKRSSVYIATIEKGHSLVNSLIENNRLQELGLVIVDEFHMIGEGGSRGAILETLLTKLLFLTENIQIIGMSATLGNIEDLKTFLGGDVFHHNFRPVELKEYIKLKNSILEFNPKYESKKNPFKWSRDVKFKYSDDMISRDPDHIAGLVSEVIPYNSCLVFCATKQNCENVATLICRGLSRRITEYKDEEKSSLLKALEEEGSGKICKILTKTIPYGIAYHHSGLTMDERRLLEEGYSNGTLCCLTCTSTLAAGVNLPARRVILRSPYVANQFMNRNKYKQMVGRAGRAGIDDAGESILILKPSDFARVAELLTTDEDKCFSSLFQDPKGLETLLLSLIGLKIAATTMQVDKFLNRTLLSVQKHTFDFDMTKARAGALESLASKKLINQAQTSGDDVQLEVTKLGLATFKGSIDVNLPGQLYQDLKRGLQSLVLHDHLHLLHLITPYDTDYTLKPQINIFYRLYTRLGPEDVQVANVLGFTESNVSLMLTGRTPKNFNQEIYHRFYVTLVLHDLWRHHSVWNTATEFELHRGVVQNLVSSSVAFASCVYHFCEELPEFWALKLLLEDVVQQLSFCAAAELLPLMELPAVKRGRAMQLYKAGFRTLQQIAQAKVDDLIRNIDHMPRKVAKQIIATSQMLVIEKALDLRNQAEDLLSGLQPALPIVNKK